MAGEGERGRERAREGERGREKSGEPSVSLPRGCATYRKGFERYCERMGGSGQLTVSDEKSLTGTTWYFLRSRSTG